MDARMDDSKGRKRWNAIRNKRCLVPFPQSQSLRRGSLTLEGFCDIQFAPEVCQNPTRAELAMEA